MYYYTWLAWCGILPEDLEEVSGEENGWMDGFFKTQDSQSAAQGKIM